MEHIDWHRWPGANWFSDFLVLLYGYLKMFRHRAVSRLKPRCELLQAL